MTCCPEVTGGGSACCRSVSALFPASGHAFRLTSPHGSAPNLSQLVKLIRSTESIRPWGPGEARAHTIGVHGSLEGSGLSVCWLHVWAGACGAARDPVSFAAVPV